LIRSDRESESSPAGRIHVAMSRDGGSINLVNQTVGRSSVSRALVSGIPPRIGGMGWMGNLGTCSSNEGGHDVPEPNEGTSGIHLSATEANMVRLMAITILSQQSWEHEHILPPHFTMDTIEAES